MSMTKRDLVTRISNDTDLIQQDVMTVVQKTLDYITEALIAGKTVELRNFGVFEVKRRAPRKARNPRTGDKVFVPEKYVVTFKPGKEMEERVKELERQAAAAARSARVKTAGKDPAAKQTPQPLGATTGYGSGRPDS